MTTIKALTLNAFAELPTSWPESLSYSDGVLIARIHPNCNGLPVMKKFWPGRWSTCTAKATCGD
ncbi:hypothetical protein [Mycobacterium paraseoulense]|uniref:hypothetical protein n=1 Tax=Mycobacterium paraseoulense TaxID=590652 RepID=UPI001150A0E9|nr:hypothetical protein [Mycobacterium paraseoulense]MCV7394376.1 hypothetical protein [Mycobacterium paraseoulense]